jgi:hypothetical protein
VLAAPRTWKSEPKAHSPTPQPAGVIGTELIVFAIAEIPRYSR